MAYYVLITSVLTFGAVITIPTDLRPFSHIVASLIVSIAFGWLIWPLAIWAAVEAARNG